MNCFVKLLIYSVCWYNTLTILFELRVIRTEYIELRHPWHELDVVGSDFRMRWFIFPFPQHAVTLQSAKRLDHGKWVLGRYRRSLHYGAHRKVNDTSLGARHVMFQILNMDNWHVNLRITLFDSDRYWWDVLFKHFNATHRTTIFFWTINDYLIWTQLRNFHQNKTLCL